MGVPVGKELLLLEILAGSGRPRYGKEMMEEAGLKHGTIYPTLYRMEERGYVTAWEERAPGERGIGRRMYQITGLGQRALNAAYAAAAAFAKVSIAGR